MKEAASSAPSLAVTVGVSTLIGGIASCLFFADSAPAAVELSLREEYGVTQQDMAWMYSVYSVPNLFMPLISGAVMDAYGLKVAGAGLLGLVSSGASLFAAAPSTFPERPVAAMLAGRLVLGLGGESIITFAQAASTARFGGTPRESLSMGCVMAVCQLASASAFRLLERIAKHAGVDAADWTVVLWCVASSLLFCIWAATQPARRRHSEVVDDSTEGKRHVFSGLFWLENVAIFFIVTTFYTSATFFPYLLAERGYDPVDAGRVTSLVYLAVACAPAFGHAADRLGHRLTVQIVVAVLAALVFLLLYACPDLPAAPLVGLVGLAFACLEQNSLTLLSRTFPDSARGAGYGIMGVFLNVGLILLPLLVGACNTATASFAAQNLIFASCLVAGAAVSCAVFLLDRGRVLNLTAAQAAARLKQPAYGTLLVAHPAPEIVAPPLSGGDENFGIIGLDDDDRDHDVVRGSTTSSRLPAEKSLLV